MENIPSYINVTFILTTALAVWIFFRASKNLGLFLIITLAWLALQAILGTMGFYTNTSSVPPRFFLLPLPPLVFILAMFLTKKGRRWMDSLDLKLLTWLHIVRIPVELVLFLLFKQGVVPKIMIFEGSNPDILSGITSVLVAVTFFRDGKIKKYGLLIWNLICLILLINIVYHAVFSLPFPMQKFGLDMPNRALLYFPYIWLPCCIVPLVLLAHLASIRQLLKKENTGK